MLATGSTGRLRLPLALSVAVMTASGAVGATGGRAPETAVTGAAPDGGVVPAARAPTVLVTEPQMLDATTALAQAVGRARRTPVRIDWQRHLVSAAEARAAAEAIVRGGAAPAETEIDEKLFQRLGLFDSGASYLDLIARSVARAPVGFYDPVARRLSVPDFISLPEQRPTLAHEIAHAIQDQRFGLRRFLKTTPDGRRGLSFDAALARQALIEGDASVLAMEVLDPRGTFPSPLELAETAQRARDGVAFVSQSPRFLRELLAFPYIDGFAFVARERATASWTAIDAIWARPPESTAQILHPERYDRRQSPIEIELPPLPLMGDGLRLARADTLGELLLRIWLASPGPGLAADPLVTPEVAERASTGWRGDRIAIYVPASADLPASPAVDAGVSPAARNGAALAWLTVWESDADADDFLQTVAPRLAALAAGGEFDVTLPVDANDRAAVWRERSGDSVFAVQRRGTLVALLLGAPEAAVPSLGTMLDALSPRRGDRGRRARPTKR